MTLLDSKREYREKGSCSELGFNPPCVTMYIFKMTRYKIEKCKLGLVDLFTLLES